MKLGQISDLKWMLNSWAEIAVLMLLRDILRPINANKGEEAPVAINLLRSESTGLSCERIDEDLEGLFETGKS